MLEAAGLVAPSPFLSLRRIKTHMEKVSKQQNNEKSYYFRNRLIKKRQWQSFETLCTWLFLLWNKRFPIFHWTKSEVFKDFLIFFGAVLKVQSCIFYNNKYMIASIQITNTEMFVFIAVLVFKILSGKVLSINR